MNQLAGPRTVLGPFTAREVTYLGGAVLLALASLFSFGRTRGDFVVIMLCLLAPLGAAAAMAWRRWRGRPRVDFGSFSLDQLAAVVAAGALVVSLGGLGGAGAFAQLVGILGSIAMCAATWGARWITAFGIDFEPAEGVSQLRQDVREAHAAPDAASGGVVVVAPLGESFGSADAPASAASSFGARASSFGSAAASKASSFGQAAASAAASGAATAAAAVNNALANATGKSPAEGEPAASGTGEATAPATPHTTVIASAPLPAQPDSAPFWFAVPDEREAKNRATGAVAFTIRPGEWWLAVRRVPEGIIVRHEDGTEALLTDTAELELG